MSAIITVQHRVLLQGPPTLLTKALPGLDPVEPPNITAWLAKLNGTATSSVDGAQAPTAPRVEAPDPNQPARRRRTA